jgi:hypothetical protein
MNTIISRFASSFYALLADPSPSVDVDGRTHEIREEMLKHVDLTPDTEAEKPLVWQEINVARDVESLWYLRSDVLQHLGEHHGERVARQKIDAITEMFRGIIPKNQMPSGRGLGR